MQGIYVNALHVCACALAILCIIIKSLPYEYGRNLISCDSLEENTALCICVNKVLMVVTKQKKRFPDHLNH